MTRWDDETGVPELGKATRRDFMGRALGLGAAVALATGVAGKALHAAAPKRGGRLRHATEGGSTSDSLDPATISDTHPIISSWQVRNNLTEITAEGELVGELAESWEPSKDARTWSFKLRKGVEFHNGKPLDVEDVIYSIDHHRGPGSKSGAAALVKGIADIKADGKDRVVFTLREGDADFPYLLEDYHLAIAIAGTKGAEWDKGIGTGPFVQTQWVPGVRSAGKRNPNYFKAGRPYFDEVETLNVADVVARTSALQSGAVDVIDRPDPKTLDLLARRPGIVVKDVGGYQHYNYPMRADRAPFTDNNVRLAVKYAMNREAMLKTILDGHGYIGNDQPIAKNMPYYDSGLEQRRYDPDKAKWHLKQAGFDKLSLTLDVGEIYPGATDGALVLKQYAAKAGLDIDVRRVPTDGYWSEVWLKKDWCAAYWSGRPTCDWMFSVAYAGNAPWNDSHWHDERFDKLLVAARTELDQAKRRQMYAEMQRLVSDEGSEAIPVFANWVTVTTDKIRTPPKVAGNWALDGLKDHERWWFA